MRNGWNDDYRLRPIFSPTDFIQIKGRGTRTHNFLDQLFDDSIRDGVRNPVKKTFKLFDFFADCQYFEEDFNYDEVLKLPAPKSKGTGDDGGGGGRTGLVVVGGTSFSAIRILFGSIRRNWRAQGGEGLIIFQ